ncbi:MAG: RsmB/NOP family class I SAM-dependent RNA methyltransferase [Verrucomicrobia bacterium]|nr:RsmB/NOP family class I SAM-dependent RNA methyltransferase [Verrucomicrobiota bacterium]
MEIRPKRDQKAFIITPFFKKIPNKTFIGYNSHVNFREHHRQKILSALAEDRGPLDLFLNSYFRSHKAIGSKDRRFLSDTIYDDVRWKGLIDYLGQRPENFIEASQDATIPPHIRVSFPLELFNLLSQNEPLCRILNERAPTVIRINPLKTSRESLLKAWEGKYQCAPTEHSPWGIVFKERVHLLSLPEFQEGLFEIQDEASQLAAAMLEAKPKDHVLDYCAGSGGKTLAFAPAMQGQGQIYLHDIRLSALQKARLRLRRAGIQNVQFQISPKLKGKMDWVFVDAPCSGTGTLRRNPDLKWKFNLDMLHRLVEEQRQIFAEALTYLSPHGSIIYATCSLLTEENEKQIAFFEEKHQLKSQKIFRSIPESGGMDGFFASVLVRNR